MTYLHIAAFAFSVVACFIALIALWCVPDQDEMKREILVELSRARVGIERESYKHGAVPPTSDRHVKQTVSR